MKTVKVRIALEINPAMEWQACGNHRSADFDGALDPLPDLMGDVRRYWIEADVAVPDADIPTIDGRVMEPA